MLKTFKVLAVVALACSFPVRASSVPICPVRGFPTFIGPKPTGSKLFWVGLAQLHPPPPPGLTQMVEGLSPSLVRLCADRQFSNVSNVSFTTASGVMGTQFLLPGECLDINMSSIFISSPPTTPGNPVPGGEDALAAPGCAPKHLVSFYFWIALFYIKDVAPTRNANFLSTAVFEASSAYASSRHYIFVSETLQTAQICLPIGTRVFVSNDPTGVHVNGSLVTSLSCVTVKGRASWFELPANAPAQSRISYSLNWNSSSEK